MSQKKKEGRTFPRLDRVNMASRCGMARAMQREPVLHHAGRQSLAAFGWVSVCKSCCRDESEPTTFFILPISSLAGKVLRSGFQSSPTIASSTGSSHATCLDTATSSALLCIGAYTCLPMW